MREAVTFRDPRLMPVDPVVFSQGQRARRRGEDKSRCPYMMGENVRSWEAGWLDEDDAMRQKED